MSCFRNIAFDFQNGIKLYFTPQIQISTAEERFTLSTMYLAVKDTPITRPFQCRDQKECQQIFKDGYQEFTKHITIIYLLILLKYIVIAAVFALLAGVLWSAWIFVVFVLIIFTLLAFICTNLQLSSWRYINDAMMSGDLKDIEKSYMSYEHSHMWVAEWNDRVVGMVGFIHKEDHEQGVYELKRMYVVPTFRRMGIAKSLVNELITHAKKCGIKKVILKTGSTLVPAIQLYMKSGFKFVTSTMDGRSTDTPVINKRHLPRDIHLELVISSLTVTAQNILQRPSNSQ